MLTQALDVARYVKASAGRASLNVVFENNNSPRHNGKTIYLPKITRATTKEEIQEIMASTDHEVAHDLYSDFNILKEKNISTTKSSLGIIWNFIEDSRVNALEAKMYPGFRELWDQTSPVLLKKIKERVGGEEALDIIISSLIKWETKVSAPLFPNCEFEGSKYVTNNDLDAILDVFTDRLLTCQNEFDKVLGSTGTYELARDIFRALGGDPDKEEEKYKDGESDEGTKTKSKEESTEGDPAKDVKTKGEGEEKIEERWCIKKINLTDIEDKLPSTHEEDESTDRMSKVGLLYKIAKDGDRKSYRKMCSLDEFIVIDYSKNKINGSIGKSLLDTTRPGVQFFKDSFNEHVVGKMNVIDNFAQQVRRLIQIRAKTRYEYGVKKGKLDYSKLSRLALKTPGFSERVFKNKINNTTLDAAVTVLIDMSGSMSGHKLLYATQSALLLNEVFSVLSVPVEILGFTDASITGSSPPIGYVFKSYSDLKLSEDKLLTNIAAASTYMKGNPDGDCILWAYDRLIRRKEKKRLLLVMSDGQPACSGSNEDLAEFTADVIKEIEKAKKVEIYGLGLCDESVKDYYKYHSTVNNPEDIPIKLLQLIERKILND